MDYKVEFASLDDLAELLERVGMRLHAKNRIAAGESGYLWHLAEVIRATGALARMEQDDPTLRDDFGDGYRSAALSDEEQLARILNLIKDQRKKLS